MRRRAALILWTLVLLSGCRDKDDDRKAAAPMAGQKKDEGSGPGVTLARDAQDRAGIKVEAVDTTRGQQESVAFGHLEEDPSSAFEVRASVAGTLRADKSRAWPTVGQTLPDGALLGYVEPRLTVTDQMGLKTQLATARADLNASAASVTAAQVAYDRARVLNADNKNVSDRVVQEAAARLSTEQAREAGLRSLIQNLETPVASVPVVAVRGGEVTAVTAQTGEWVEPGTALVRMARFDHLLARIDFPVGERVPAGASSPRIVPSGFEGQISLRAERVAIVAASDPHVQGVSVLYRLTGTMQGLRPGVPVSAYFAMPGKGHRSVVPPPGAIVQQDGRSWVYVQTANDRFSRRELPGGLAPGDRVVVTGAQMLLSEELKASNAPDTD